jgi:hypothetical protein
MRELVRLHREPFFRRWIIVPADELDRPRLGWSGSRWVPIGGPVQISNFDERSHAESYAASAGFEVENETVG